MFVKGISSKQVVFLVVHAKWDIRPPLHADSVHCIQQYTTSMLHCHLTAVVCVICSGWMYVCSLIGS